MSTHWRRYRQIADALARHGLGYLVGAFGLERFVPFHRGILGHPRRPEPYTRPEHVRMALEDIGAAAIKLGQILSTRSDLLPPEYVAELAKLQDSAPAVPFEQVSEVLVAELGRPLEEAFARFEPRPLAAASIGQAHAAVLEDGTEVVVKVRRPGVVAQVREDLEILRNLATVASRRWEAAERYDVVALANEFADTLRHELDYLGEGRNAERFAGNFADDAGVHVPRVFWDTSTSRVLTLERIRGLKVDDLRGLEEAGIDRERLAVRSARMLLKMVFEDGFYHADPHPGNFFIEPGGRIGLIDFGMVGTLDRRTREALTEVLVALAGPDTERLVEAIVDIGVASGGVDRGALALDLERLLSEHYGQPLGSISIGPLLEGCLSTVRRHRLQLPSRFALLLKTVIMSEGLGAALDPDFRLTGLLAPYARRLVVERYSPASWARRLSRSALQAARLTEELPGELRHLLRLLDQEGITVRLQPDALQPLGDRIEAAARRVVVAILVAAVVIGLAVHLTEYHPSGIAFWTIAGFVSGILVAAVVIGAYRIVKPGPRVRGR